MGRFRPRGNSMQRTVGRSVKYGLREMKKGNDKTRFNDFNFKDKSKEDYDWTKEDNWGCLIIFIIVLGCFLIILSMN
jgi:hypothetical protein